MCRTEVVAGGGSAWHKALLAVLPPVLRERVAEHPMAALAGVFGVTAALLVLAFVRCARRAAFWSATPTVPAADLARLRNKYECRVAQAEALSLLTLESGATDGDSTGSAPGSR